MNKLVPAHAARTGEINEINILHASWNGLSGLYKFRINSEAIYPLESVERRELQLWIYNIVLGERVSI
jgi:hypothetical protein